MSTSGFSNGIVGNRRAIIEGKEEKKVSFKGKQLSFLVYNVVSCFYLFFFPHAGRLQTSQVCCPNNAEKIFKQEAKEIGFLAKI